MRDDRTPRRDNQSNRWPPWATPALIVLALAGPGALVFLSIAGLAGYALWVLPSQRVEMQTAATAQAVQNAQIRHALTATSLAATLGAVTATPAATVTAVGSADQSLALPTPQGAPASEWEGVPIMPGAIAGEARDGGYSFTILATPPEVQAFYEPALVGLGWQPLATGQGSNGPAMIIFTKDSATVSIVILPLEGGVLQVMVVK